MRGTEKAGLTAKASNGRTPNRKNIMFKRLDAATVKQIMSFGVIGVLNTLIDMAVFALLVFLNVHYAAAQLAAYGAGMTNSYFMNRAFTFRTDPSLVNRTEERRRKLRFAAWNVAMLTLSILMLAVATDWLMWRELPAKAVVTALIVAVNFYGSKKWVFAVKPAIERGGQRSRS
ncbi:GtrA family protein [Paenibacillus soyae]|uniref:GtrA family protein n=1 Tax=Paenibacillus soyae TaxID=2969249 RepID=A0A9X2MR60_9BACL|nr:GtrA family protein [Paenibacillus soyae]MCR2804333.1 GtrA family protein [Paenibacillus soyae]